MGVSSERAMITFVGPSPFFFLVISSNVDSPAAAARSLMLVPLSKSNSIDIVVSAAIILLPLSGQK